MTIRSKSRSGLDLEKWILAFLLDGRESYKRVSMSEAFYELEDFVSSSLPWTSVSIWIA